MFICLFVYLFVFVFVFCFYLFKNKVNPEEKVSRDSFLSKTKQNYVPATPALLFIDCCYGDLGPPLLWEFGLTVAMDVWFEYSFH
jgi:hypothetical protein